MDKIPWNRVILDEYVSLALLTEEEEKIIRTRAAGWSQVKQCHTFSMSPAALARKIKKSIFDRRVREKRKKNDGKTRVFPSFFIAL